jgi:transposase
VLFVGDDWAEAHHDIEIEDESGRVLARRRLPEGLAGITTLHELVAEHLDPTAEPDQVQVGIETDRGPWVQALLAAGYVVFAINPLQVARYRERHSPSGAKSDAADATCWPRSSGWIGRITAESPATVSSPNTSRSQPAPIRR